MPPSRGARSAQRKTTPQSPRRPPSSTTSPQQTRRSGRTTSREPEPQPRQTHLQLATVTEEPQIVVVDPSLDDEHLSELSAASQSEYGSLDTEEILEGLPGFWDESIRMVQFFAKERNRLERLRYGNDPKTFPLKRFTQIMTPYLELRALFGSRVFITPRLVARKLQGTADDDVSWRPDAVVYAANVAWFLATMITADESRKEEAIQDVYQSFPDRFAPLETGLPFSTTLIGETIELANHLRTQAFIMRVDEAYSNAENFDPDSFLRDLFRTETLAFRGLEITEPEESEYYQTTIEGHIRAIRSYVTTDPTTPVKLVDLQEAYPFSNFIHELLRWSEARIEELKIVIQGQGGIEAIVQKWRGAADEDEINLEMSAAGSLAEPQAMAVTGRSPMRQIPGKKMANMSRLKDINNEIAARDTNFDTQSQSVQGDSISVVNILGDEILDEGDQRMAQDLLSAIGPDDVPPNPDPFQHQQILAELALQRANDAPANQQAEVQQSRRFLDPQPNARSLNFDDEDTQQAPRRNGKRAATQDEDDDDDFQTDTRNARPAKRSRRPVNNDNIDPQLRTELPLLEPDDFASAQASHPQSSNPLASSIRHPGRPRTNKNAPSSSAPPAGAQGPHSTPGPSSANALMSASQDDMVKDPDTVDFPASQRFQEIRAKAKENIRMKKTIPFPLAPSGSTQLLPDSSADDNDADGTITQRVSIPSSYQVRKTWAPAEEARLIELIRVCGPAYAKILKMDAQHIDGAVLQGRNQVQLKDKARNIKFAYYKSNEPLPPGFGPVSIGKKLVDKLRELGFDASDDWDGREAHRP